MLVQASFLTAYALLALRIVTAIVFFSSGKSHAQKPVERGKQIEMSPAVTKVLGVAEIIAAISIAFGIFTQVGAAIIICVMLGAIYKKIVEWKTGFYADKGFGWHYDLMFLCAALVIFTTAGGSWTII